MMTQAAQRTILIIEDEVSLRDALRDKFTRMGFLVFEAVNGSDGLEVALHHHPDLLLLDIVMPRMDGITMLKKLREDAWGKGAKVMVLTNYSDRAWIAESLESGVYEFLIKTDWKLEDIVAKVIERLKA